MRKLIVIAIVLALIVGGTIAYLVATTPKSAPPLRFPLTAEQQTFVARASSSDSFAFVPAVAVVHAKLLANPVTHQPLLDWTEKQPLPRPWMLGGADLLVWRSGKSTHYAVRFDSVRATIVRIWTMIAGPHDASWEGNVMVIADPAPAGKVPLDLSIADGLPEGDAFVVQQNRARGAFPPIGRPAFSSIRITPKELLIVSRAHTDEATPLSVIKPSYRKGAMLAVGFAQPPRILGDLNRLLGADIGKLVSNGGAISLYDVDAGLLLPRPKGVIAIRADDAGRQAIDDYRQYIELVGQTAEREGELLVSFDQRSLGTYINDAIVEAAWPANRWAGRIDPVRLLPVLRRLGDNRGLRFASPRMHRAVRDLRNWIDALQNAESIEAAESATGGVEELRVRVLSK
ncbi:MAG TPA: hypothetical protein VHW00_09550 [Thermoanaerobaculia bacterium]|nr:hypothetical protein [Thermoanaerobaculia bacterium]